MNVHKYKSEILSALESAVLRAVYTCDFARCDCHPGVCNKFVTVYETRYPLMIRYSLSSTLWSVKHVLYSKMSIARHKITRVDRPLTNPKSLALV